MFGEAHAHEFQLARELEAWDTFYHEHGMRHIFIEYAYYTAEFLNLWMQADDDELLEKVYESWYGTQAYSPVVKDFFMTIKEEYPETIFHGTDIGHQAYTLGQQYLKYIKDNNLEKTETHELALEAIQQGIDYYGDISNHPFREKKMAENFIREYEKIKGESIMGIYGALHVHVDADDCATSTVPSMGKKLKEVYGDLLYVEDLTATSDNMSALDQATMTINNKDYIAYYYGKKGRNGFKGIDLESHRRLYKAFDDFKDLSKTGEYLPYSYFEFSVKRGDVIFMSTVFEYVSIFSKHKPVQSGFFST